MPLVERKKRLARLVRAAKCSRLLYAQHIEQHGKGFFAEICARDLEGIVAKRKLGIYKDDGNIPSGLCICGCGRNVTVRTNVAVR